MSGSAWDRPATSGRKDPVAQLSSSWGATSFFQAMTDEEIAEFFAKSHAAFVATIMDALQLDCAPPAQTGRPVVERREVVRPVVERREVVRPVVERCEVATC